MTEERLTLKEMCARFDVTPRTLRYYEYIELIAPEKDGRTRYYGATEFARMTLILRGRRWGFSLEEIRQWLEMYDEHGEAEQLEAWVEASGKQLEELESRRQQLDETIQDLRAMRDRVKASLAK
ncbi:MAG: MerR family DNA-binding transcriptional regulator [Pseudomonadota bacterium]